MVVFVNTCSVILRSVFLNRFVIKVISLPIYVKVVYSCVGVVICLSGMGEVC
jgi:hypothetical protein